MKNNQDKANELFKFLTNLYNSCGGECEECSLNNVCDDLDIIKFHIKFDENAILLYCQVYFGTSQFE